MSKTHEYTKEKEDLYLMLFKADPELFVRCRNIIFPGHYQDVTNKKAVEFILEHVDQYGSIPNDQQLKAVAGKVIDPIEGGIDDGTKDWMLDEYEGFAQYRAVEAVIYDAPDMIAANDTGKMMELMKAAVELSLVKDLGMDYFLSPKARLDAMEAKNGTVSTGFKHIDEKLNGGTNRGEISIVAGQSGTGKSLFLQNIALNWVKLGLNVVYISLELSEDLCAMRMDAMVTDMSTKDVWKSRDDVELKVMTFKKNSSGGTLRIKQMKNGSTANDIKAYVKEYEIQTGIKADAIVIDYLDLCMPTNAKISAENLFVKDKYVTENLRDLAVEMQVLMFTASQLNRSSYEEDTYTHANISGGMSKINTADNVMAIHTTPQMKESGRFQIQFMKTRSSAGVGQQIDLAYNPKTMRMSDSQNPDQNSQYGSTTLATKVALAQLQQDGLVSPTIEKKPSQLSTLQRSANLSDILKRIDD